MRSTRLFPPLGLAILLLGSGCPAPQSSPGAEAQTSPRAGSRVILIGVDGLEWRVIDGLMAQGRLPNFSRFFEKSARGPLETLIPTYSPVIWASIATGKLPEKHGITGFVTRDAHGRRQPFTSGALNAAPLWQIVGDADRRSAVVGWWTTWPAQPIDGVMVSDRMLYNRFNLWFGLKHFGEDLPAQSFPEDWVARLSDLTRLDPALEDEFFRRFSVDGRRFELKTDLHDPWYELYLVHARDRAYFRMVQRVQESESFDLLAFYINGTDIASHYFWKYLYPGDTPTPPSDEAIARMGNVIPRYYEYVDAQLAPWLESADDETVVALISDHGFLAGTRDDTPNISGTHYRTGPPGVLAFAGGGIAPGTTVEGAHVTDVTPTLLHLMGLPVGRDMDGRVLPFAERLAAPRYVESHERPEREAPRTLHSSVHDEAIMEKLRALGYID